MKDGNVAPAAQVHPTLFDKQIWLDAIMRRKDLTDSAKVLAWRLADHHNQRTGQCNPSLPVLSEGTGRSRSVVHENLTALRDAGLIDWTSGNSSRSNSYVLKGVEIHDRTAKPTRKGGKDPGPTSEAVIIPFPGTAQTVPEIGSSQALETVRPNGLRQSGLSDRSPSGQPDTNSPILTPEGTLSPSTPSKASEGPATPFSPSTGRQGVQDSTHPSQPAAKVDRQTKPRETTWPDTLGWTRDVYEMASDYQPRGSGFIKEAFLAFKAHAMKNRRRSTDWHAAWLTWYKEACRLENEKRLRGRNAGI